jgi:hypothetical protein
MEKIEFINPDRFRNDEHYQFMADLNALVTKTTPVTLNIETLYPSFADAFEQEDQVMKVELGSSRSDVIRKLDKDRDKTWNAIDMRISATVISPFPAEAQAATILKRVMDLYGDKRNSPYNEETASLTNLLSDLLSDANAPHVAAVGIRTWITALKEQNEIFQEEFDARTDENSKKIKSDTAPYRGKVDEAYFNIVNRINATIELDTQKAGVADFVRNLNEIIAYEKRTLAIRKGRKLAEKDDEDEPKPAK